MFGVEVVIGPDVFEDVTGNPITVTGERCRDMMQNLLAPQIRQLNLQSMQDGTTCHTMNLLSHLEMRSGPQGHQI